MFESRQIYPCLLLSCALKIRKMNENRNRLYWYLFLCCKQLAVGYRESEMIFWTLSGQNSLVKRQTKNQTNKESNKTRLSLKRVEKLSLSVVFLILFPFISAYLKLILVSPEFYRCVLSTHFLVRILFTSELNLCGTAKDTNIKGRKLFT